jgi:hypothetical protein
MSGSRMMRRFAVTAGCALAASVSVAAPASADPKGGDIFALTCEGTTYAVVVKGNGMFTPAHDTGSNTNFIPVFFGEFTGIVTDASGDVIASFTDPPFTKGAGNNADLDCTYTFAGTFEDPELGLLTVAGTGTVSGFATPRR